MGLESTQPGEAPRCRRNQRGIRLWRCLEPGAVVGAGGRPWVSTSITHMSYVYLRIYIYVYIIYVYIYIYICIDTYIRIMYDMCDRHRFYIYVHMIYTRDVSSDHHPPLRPGFREIGRPVARSRLRKWCSCRSAQRRFDHHHGIDGP